MGNILVSFLKCTGHPAGQHLGHFQVWYPLPGANDWLTRSISILSTKGKPQAGLGLGWGGLHQGPGDAQRQMQGAVLLGPMIESVLLRCCCSHCTGNTLLSQQAFLLFLLIIFFNKRLPCILRAVPYPSCDSSCAAFHSWVTTTRKFGGMQWKRCPKPLVWHNIVGTRGFAMAETISSG